MTADDVINELKSALVTLATAQVMVAIISAVPFFGLPVIKQITELTVKVILNFAVNKSELGVYSIYQDNYTAFQARAFKAAVLVKHAAKTPEEEEKANLDLINTARRFIRFGA